MKLKKSPFAPLKFPELPAVPGVKFSTCVANIKNSNKLDLMLMVFKSETVVAGVMTKSSITGAPVTWNRRILKAHKGRALIVNSGNANVFTGDEGEQAVVQTAEKVANVIGCSPEEVFVCSTGTIGEPLDARKIVNQIPSLNESLQTKNWLEPATAILTTDTYQKGCSRTTSIHGTDVQIVGIAKGSGMIAPDMATMLAYIVTDAKIPSDVAQSLIADGAENSFNCITVDSDTSTSDSLFLFSSGATNHTPIEGIQDPALQGFKSALNEVLLDLAHQVVKDGEGAQKFIEVRVKGAADSKAAKEIGLSVCNSPLVKTAVAGADPNWGRIVMAIGKSGQKSNQKKIDVSIGNIMIAHNGALVRNYSEAPVKEHMQGRSIEIEINVGVGNGSAKVWGCDLTHTYIDINADYRS
jgi:glutamate N-acetyltransferase/amino-acid N-acetyltransferase